MSARLELYNAIMAAVGEHAPEIAHVGFWNNSVVYSAEEISFPLPALLVEFGDIEWDTFCKLGDGLMARGDGTVTLHLLTEFRGDADFAAAFQAMEELGEAMASIPSEADYDVICPVQTHTDGDHTDLMETVDSYKVRFSRRFGLSKTGE